MTTIRNRSGMAAIRQTIADYMRHKASPSVWDLQAFVGMIETGEATLDDFGAVGGDDLAAAVRVAIKCRLSDFFAGGT